MTANIIDITSYKAARSAKPTTPYGNLPPNFRRPCFYLMRAQLDVDGPGVLAYHWVLDDDPVFIDYVVAAGNLKMTAKLGFGRTGMGGVLISLTQIMTSDEREVLGIYDGTFDPEDSGCIYPWYELVHQPTWHLLVFGAAFRLLMRMDYENSLALAEALEKAIILSGTWPTLDFERAEAEFAGLYSIWELIEMSEEEYEIDLDRAAEVPPVFFFPEQLTLMVRDGTE
jgi:hypothetical protein